VSGPVWILVFLTSAGAPAISHPMWLESCVTLMDRPEFSEAFCFNREYPAITLRRKAEGK
jgi:hypothetical protein